MTTEHRIAVAGASGTGKTTLAKFLGEELHLPFNPVGSRSVAQAMGYASPYDVDAAGRRAEFQQRVINEKVAWEDGHDQFVTDRTTFDNIVYTMMHDVSAVTEEMFTLALRGVQRYTAIIYCPVNVFCDLSDPIRVQSKTYQELFDVMIDGLLRRYASRYKPLECRTVRGRKAELLNYFEIKISGGEQE